MIAVSRYSHLDREYETPLSANHYTNAKKYSSQINSFIHYVTVLASDTLIVIYIFVIVRHGIDTIRVRHLYRDSPFRDYNIRNGTIYMVIHRYDIRYRPEPQIQVKDRPTVTGYIQNY